VSRHHNSHAVTIKDLAVAAGVSVMTVSRALNGKSDVTDETRERIVELAKQKGYIINGVARDLRTRTTRVLGVIITDNSNPYFARVVRGIQDTASQHGYSIILSNTDEDPKREQQMVRLLQEVRVAGLLLTPSFSNYDDIISLTQSGFPLVLINRHLEGIDASYVIGDDTKGAYLVTSHLIRRGFRRILFINGPETISPARDRMKGYQQAMAENGIRPEPELIFNDNLTLDNGYTTMQHILKSFPAPLGVLCFSDYVAIGAIKAIKEASFRIPEDVSIAGYDDVDVAAYLASPLTTVKNPCYQIGQTATELLIDIIEGRAEQKGHAIALEPELVVRTSC